MWIKICLLLTSFIFQVSLQKLLGNNICQEEERYVVNVTEYFLRNSTIRSYRWCLNVPPRCSFYTIKEINDSRIVPKEEIRITEKCCPGYKINENNNSCEADCSSCVQGVCEQNKCICLTGFSGENCDKACEPTNWGVNCKNQCSCMRGNCNSKTGNCECPLGWKGSRCEIQCPNGYFGYNCEEKCQCKEDESCHIVTGLCKLQAINITSVTNNNESSSTSNYTEIIESYSTSKSTNIDSINNGSHENLFLNDSSTTTVSSLDFTTRAITKTYILANESTNNIVIFKNNGKLKPVINKFDLKESTIEFSKIHDLITKPTFKDNYLTTTEATSTKVPYRHEIEKQDHAHNKIFDELHINSTNQQNEIMKSSNSKGKVNTMINVTTDINIFHEENYLSDEMPEDNINQASINKNDLVNSASAATAVAIAIIIIAVLIVTAKHYRNTKKQLKAEAQVNKPLPTVSFFTQSIFHTPLPDPPSPINTSFASPIETHSNDGTRFETHVVCSMNFPTSITKDPREFLYDHPPSTGSYRAASIPEPPDSEKLSQNSTLAVMEPVYDEIPLRGIPTPITQPPPSYKSSSLYMNTSARTRF